MKHHAWQMLGVIVAALGVVAPLAAQSLPPTVELREYRSDRGPGTAVGFTLGGELFANGHRPRVSLKIYNVLAQVVATPLLDATGEALSNLELACADPVGCTYTASWDGRVPSAGRIGTQRASGVYLYQLTVDGTRYTKKMVMVR
ncbi:MAG TPA: hypothetical protein VN848_00430 [Gemmatimonadales bacterium]|nr:hypothetical protein [Gemmatimonadales bacterium]